LLEEILSYQQGGQDLATYFTNLKILWQELDTYALILIGLVILVILALLCETSRNTVTTMLFERVE
jgi:DMSO/TMAO reductase YedYZ heme-binding membrane subunit